LSAVSADAFMLPVGSGHRFCVLRWPGDRARTRGSVLVAAPFAEELNKSRRTIALAAERMAADGYAVLHMDNLGCGDSSGDFGDATWDEWISDIGRGYALLESRQEPPIWIWGIRAGALLASALLTRLPSAPHLLFWQPVTSGQQHLKQFLRLKVANAFLGDSSAGLSTDALLGRLKAGESIEVAGYMLTPALASGLASAELDVPPGFTGRVVCLEQGNAASQGTSAALAARVQAWRRAGSVVTAAAVNCLPFWQTQQITEAPELIDVTLSCLREVDE